MILHLPLSLLKRHDFFLNGSFSDETIDGYRIGLADAVAPIDGLVFNRWIPPRIQQEDIVGILNST
jgi:hypothetical protein